MNQSLENANVNDKYENGLSSDASHPKKTPRLPSRGRVMSVPVPSTLSYLFARPGSVPSEPAQKQHQNGFVLEADTIYDYEQKLAHQASTYSAAKPVAWYHHLGVSDSVLQHVSVTSPRSTSDSSATAPASPVEPNKSVQRTSSLNFFENLLPGIGLNGGDNNDWQEKSDDQANSLEALFASPTPPRPLYSMNDISRAPPDKRRSSVSSDLVLKGSSPKMQNSQKIQEETDGNFAILDGFNPEALQDILHYGDTITLIPDNTNGLVVFAGADDAKPWVEMLDDSVSVPPNLSDCEWRLQPAPLYLESKKLTKLLKVPALLCWKQKLQPKFCTCVATLCWHACLKLIIGRRVHVCDPLLLPHDHTALYADKQLGRGERIGTT